MNPVYPGMLTYGTFPRGMLNCAAPCMGTLLGTERPNSSLPPPAPWAPSGSIGTLLLTLSTSEPALRAADRSERPLRSERRLLLVDIPLPREAREPAVGGALMVFTWSK